MKKVWVEPEILVQQFVANQYVAACGESGTMYKFTCDAGLKKRQYNVFLNGDDGIAETEDDIAWTTSKQYNPVHYEGYYHPCKTTHEASTDDDFIKGYMYEQSGRYGSNSGSRIDVIVWTDNGKNTHCTTNLDMSSWQTAKS